MVDSPINDTVTTSWEIIQDKMTAWVQNFIVSIPNIVIAVAVFMLSLWLAQRVRKWSQKLLRPIVKKKTIRILISQLFSVFVILLGLVLVLSVLGLDGALNAVLAGAGIAGLAVGLALQGTLSNTFSGIILALEDDINIGDWVESLQYSGEVIDLDLKGVKLKEEDNNIVIVPNKSFLESPFKNYSLTDKIRCIIKSTVNADADLDLVKSTAIDAIQNSYPQEPPEDVQFFYTDISGESVDFLIRFYIEGKDKHSSVSVKSNAIMALKEAFKAKGL